MTEPHWEAKAPTVPGFYWHRDATSQKLSLCDSMYTKHRVVALNVSGLFELTDDSSAFSAVEMLRDSGEFWSERLKEPE